MTLTEFLLARIRDDETDANDAICQCGGPACTIERGWYRKGELLDRLGDFGDGPNRKVAHVLRWSPDRVFAECEAKRDLIDAEPTAFGGAYSINSLRRLQLLALPYADHPDYDESWRP